MNENDRIPVEELGEHPFIAEELASTALGALDIDSFSTEMSQSNKHYSGFSSVRQSVMASRFDETEI